MFVYHTEGPMLDLLHHLEHRIWPDLQRALPRILNGPTRGRDHRVATARGHLRGPDVIRLVADVTWISPSDVKITVEDNC